MSANTNCFGCWTAKPQRVTPALWVTREKDFYCADCLADEGIAQKDCVRIEHWQGGLAMAAGVGSVSAAVVSRVAAPWPAPKPIAAVAAALPEATANSDVAGRVNRYVKIPQVKCLNPECDRLCRASNKYPYCSKCQRHGMHLAPALRPGPRAAAPPVAHVAAAAPPAALTAPLKPTEGLNGPPAASQEPVAAWKPGEPQMDRAWAGVMRGIADGLGVPPVQFGLEVPALDAPDVSLPAPFGRSLGNVYDEQSAEMPPVSKRRTVWRAALSIGGRKDHFDFREDDDFVKAALTAQELLEGSPAAEMTGAVIVGLERFTRLWN